MSDKVIVELTRAFVDRVIRQYDEYDDWGITDSETLLAALRAARPAQPSALEELLDPVHEQVFEGDEGSEGDQVILRDESGQYWISEPWDDDRPGYPLSVPLPITLAIIERAALEAVEGGE